MKFISVVFVILIVLMLVIPICADKIFSNTTVEDEISNPVIKSDVIKLANAELEEEFEPIDITPKKTNVIVKVFNNNQNKIMELALEEYMYGVVLAEMPSSFNIEALKAQAVAARSYCMYRIDKTYYQTDKKHQGADVCTDYSHCKAYISYDDAVQKWSKEWTDKIYPKIKEAVDSTAGIILAYNNESANAVFHAMSDSLTESSADIWGSDIPYLQSVTSPEVENSNNSLSTIYKIDEVQFKSILKENGFKQKLSGDASLWIDNITRNESNRINSLTIGGISITGRRIREIFNLRSTNFTIDYVDGNFTFNVYGYGHGVGMSQYGANVLAERGYSYDMIVRHYYTGVELAIIDEN